MNTITKIWRLALWTMVIVLAFIFTRRISKPAEINEVVRYDTIPSDTVYIKVNNYLPRKDSIHCDTIPTDVDTLAILKDYFKSTYYSDTITNDSTFSLIINDVIAQNSIISREAFYKNLQGQIVKTVTQIPKPVNKFYIGGELLMSKNQQNLYITGTMCSKKDKIYTLGFDPVNKAFNVGFAINIKHGN